MGYKMMSTNGHMRIEEFGEALLETNDLDPIYNILHGAALTPDLLHRWIVAYTCFYHAGVASQLAEARGWGPYTEALSSAPRGTERRHFRGAFAIKAVAALRDTYEVPEAFYEYVARPPVDIATVIARVQEHFGFGPWISFKWADLLDRCCGVPLVFDEAHVFMFNDPAKAVDMLWEERVAPIERSKIDAIGRRQRVVAGLLKHFEGRLAPPSGDRPLGLAETETILCKWKSHMHGHYPIGKDTHEIREGLHGWGPLAEQLIQYLPGET